MVICATGESGVAKLDQLLVEKPTIIESSWLILARQATEQTVEFDQAPTRRDKLANSLRAARAVRSQSLEGEGGRGDARFPCCSRPSLSPLRTVRPATWRSGWLPAPTQCRWWRPVP